MTITEVRQRYLEFFKQRGHVIIPSSSLVPTNDPTTLFTGSGMQPMVPYLLGENHPAGTRITDSQKAFRADDIEEIGDNRHTTFFEMLGNWSLGDYFKQEQLSWIFEFLTGELGLDPKRLYVTVFVGDEERNLPRDTKSVALWKKLFREKGIEASDAVIGSEADGYQRGVKKGERIFYYDAKKNWWSRAGVPEKMPAGEPGGPDSEIFYDFGTTHDVTYGAQCHPNCDCGRFVEIGNSVFMQYLKNADGSFGLLPKQNVDFGGGLERIAMAVNNLPDIIEVCHRPILDYLEQASGKHYGAHAQEIKAFRIIADHIKAAVFLIADGVHPGSNERGYFVRRLIRRSVYYADALGIVEKGLAETVLSVAAMYEDQYPEIKKQAKEIADIIEQEEDRFRATLARGVRESKKFIDSGHVSGVEASMLFTTYGFPLEMVLELARDKGATVDEVGFREEMKKHSELSRAGSEQKFKGGLADTSEKTTRLHTAHHLLLKALQIVLGPEVKQRGSNITQERLRIDFSYGQKMTDEQKREAERIVNEKIEEGLPMTRSEMSREEAEALGAEHEFGAKYPERVSVYSLGPKEATIEHPHFEKAFSIEFCGGPHVTNTSVLGEGGKRFRIVKEEAVSTGVRRVRAILE